MIVKDKNKKDIKSINLLSVVSNRQIYFYFYFDCQVEKHLTSYYIPTMFSNANHS